MRLDLDKARRHSGRDRLIKIAASESRDSKRGGEPFMQRVQFAFVHVIDFDSQCLILRNKFDPRPSITFGCAARFDLNQHRHKASINSAIEISGRNFQLPTHASQLFGHAGNFLQSEIAQRNAHGLTPVGTCLRVPLSL